MRTSAISLAIPHPCKQRWEEMRPEDAGKFCGHCQKTVIDFTTQTDAQLLEIINRPNSKVCGRFLPAQLERVLQPGQPRAAYASLIPAAVLSSALITAMPQDSNAQLLKPPAVMEQTQGTLTRAAPLPEEKKAPPAFISGAFVDANCEKIPYGTIYIKNYNLPGSSSKHGAVADKDGNFHLTIPAAMSGKELVLVVSAVGYIQDEIRLTPNEITTGLQITFQTAAPLMGDVIIIRKATLWQKVKRLFR